MLFVWLFLRIRVENSGVFIWQVEVFMEYMEKQ